MPTRAQSRSLLGDISASRFLRDYWQKKPLVVRRAWKSGWITPSEIATLAARPDIEARLVSADRGKWKVSFGPQARLPGRTRDWTVLVQGANLWSAEADALLQSIDFLPRWRLDDVMVSYAAQGGGVGAHVDSYDVFLLQVQGTRRWRTSRQRDLALKPGLPLKILENFEADEEWTLEPGDMLYLPPQVAHEGVAMTACITASIGFRAPTFTEATREFFHHAADTIELAGRYRDRGRKACRDAGEIDQHLIDAVERHIAKVKFKRSAVIEFLGTYLSEPKPTVFFDDRESGDKRQLAARARQVGVTLNPRSTLLFSGPRFFFNGEALRASGLERRFLVGLANRRSATGEGIRDASPALIHQICEWLADGWLLLGDRYGAGTD
jgi:50S ribosomal protein L16 3-hydroxylase